MIKDLIKNKNAKERAEIKVDALSKRNKPKPFTIGGVKITIQEIGREKDLLKIVAIAKKEGKELKVSNPLYFKNPPIMISDGTTRTEINEFGKQVQRTNFKEDLDESIKKMVAETIKVICLF